MPSFLVSRRAARAMLRAACLTIVTLTASLAPIAPLGAQPAATAGYSVDDVLDARSAGIGDLSPDGRWLAVTVTSLRDRIGTDNHRWGDPTYVSPAQMLVQVIDTRSGERRDVFRERRQVRGLAWSPDATWLAMLLLDGERFRPVLWERATGRLHDVALPRGQAVAENASLQWSDDGGTLLLALRRDSWWRETRQRFDHELHGPIVVQSSDDPFLSWDAIRRLSFVQSLAGYDVRTRRVTELVPEQRIRSYRLTGDARRIVYEEDITEKTDYETIFGTTGRIVVRDVAGGEPRVVVASTKGINPIWSGDAQAYAFARDGRVYFGTIGDAEPRLLIGERRDSAAATPAAAPPPAPSAARDTGDARRNQRFTPVRLSQRGDVLIASNREGLWFVDTATGQRARFHDAAAEDDDYAPRWSVVAWSRDGDDIFMTYASRTEWERGLYRHRRSRGETTQLGRDDRLYSGWRLSDDGSTFVFNASAANRPADVYAADAALGNIRRLTDTNPQLADRRLAATQLVQYRDADGKRQFGVLYYPLDYVSGRSYPTIFLIYETYFDPSFNGTINHLTSHGYAVMQPSVTLETGYPGEAWLKGVTAAANTLIEMGIADPDRLGVHGTSYGGYATNLLITQTNRFKAAINISGKTNMISFYTDSPRLGVRNIHAPERSQDRLGATLWEQPQKYIAHSAIMAADRIRTPLLLITGQQDHNVTERTTSEMFYALRRLGRTVEWVSYINGGHGMPTSTVEEVNDYHRRIVDWYDRFLKDAEARTVDNGAGDR
jgi:dipeptidyl aminopeptidase/acylaminoacyl peptidase